MPIIGGLIRAIRDIQHSTDINFKKTFTQSIKRINRGGC